MSSIFIRDFGEDIKESEKGKINILSFLFGYLPLFLGFTAFVYTILGLAVTMDRIIYFLAGGDTFLGLLGIDLFLVGNLISVGIFFFGLYSLSKANPEKIRSKRSIALWRFGFLSGNWLLLLSTAICLTFLIWLAFTSFPLLYTGIRIGIVYSLLFLVFIWRSIVYFVRLKKERD